MNKVNEIYTVPFERSIFLLQKQYKLTMSMMKKKRKMTPRTIGGMMSVDSFFPDTLCSTTTRTAISTSETKDTINQHHGEIKVMWGECDSITPIYSPTHTRTNGPGVLSVK